MQSYQREQCVIPSNSCIEEWEFQKKTTLLNAIRKNNISTCPFFTESKIAKFLPNSIPTMLGNQVRTRKNSQSNQQPTFKTTEKMYINIYASINQPDMPTGKVHSDQTGRFNIKSISSKKYMMVIYAYDPNDILVEPFPDRPKE